MRTKSLSVMKLGAAAFMVYGLLLGASGAGAAANNEEHARPQEVRRPAGWSHSRSHAPARAGESKGGDAAFLKSLSLAEDSSYCESSCCWASCSQEGGGVLCTDGNCQAWCPDGSTAEATCGAT